VPITLTTDALTNVRAMISGIQAADTADVNNYPMCGTKEEMDRFEREFAKRQVERRDNVLQVLNAIFGLGGEIVAENYSDRPGLLGRNDWLTYGVVQHPHLDPRSWSVNS
jgi:hypothetical protein